MEFNRVYQVYSMLAPKPHDLVQRGRFYIREGYLRMWKDNKQKFKKRYCFLFNDVMLLCKKEGKLSSKKYWLRIHITLRSPHCSVEDNDNSYNNDFNLICRSRSFRFQCDSSNLKRSWIEDIRKSITGEHEESQKEADKSRDALLKGDLSLTGQNKTTQKSQPQKEESYESDTTSEEKPKPRFKIKDTNSPSSSPSPQKTKKKENKVEMVTENESFLIDIPATTTTFNFFTANANQSGSNPFSPQVQNSPNGSNPFSPQVQSNPNPFQAQPSNPFSPPVQTQSNPNPFAPTPTNTSSAYNPFEPNHTPTPQPQVQTSSYNPFALGGQTQQPQEQGFNPFL